jgi:hypothetical protein
LKLGLNELENSTNHSSGKKTRSNKMAEEIQVHPSSGNVFADLAWIIHERYERKRKESLKRFRIRLSRVFSLSIVP